MSYSFNLTAATKNEAKLKARERFADEVARQPCHARDQAAFVATVDHLVSMLPDDDTKDVYLACSGYVSGDWQQGDLVSLTGVSINVNAQHVARKA